MINSWFECQNWIDAQWQSLGLASKYLVGYGLVMLLGLLCTYAWSQHDQRLIREVGVWVKPMKFMSATALFALTSVWALKVADSHVDHTEAFNWMTLLLVSTSLFEVVYISYQASQASASHYNVSDPFHAFMFGLMGLAAVGLTATQAWLAWMIWEEQKTLGISVQTWGVIIGLALTFVLSTISGFMLGGHQPPAGQGIPWVGWHLHNDIRPAHFLGVHAQQFIPVWGLLSAKFMGAYAMTGLMTGGALYLLLWILATWFSL